MMDKRILRSRIKRLKRIKFDSGPTPLQIYELLLNRYEHLLGPLSTSTIGNSIMEKCSAEIRETVLQVQNRSNKSDEFPHSFYYSAWFMNEFQKENLSFIHSHYLECEECWKTVGICGAR